MIDPTIEKYYNSIHAAIQRYRETFDQTDRLSENLKTVVSMLGIVDQLLYFAQSLQEVQYE